MGRVMLSPRCVVFCRDASLSRYPDAPFSPSVAYPEYPFAGAPGGLSAAPNPVYGLFRETLRRLGLDESRYGTRDWNPFGAFVEPGQRIVLKPNFVLHFHTKGGHTDVLLTNGSVIRAALDFAYIALSAHGRFAGHLALGDSPLQRGDFDAISRLAGVPELQRFYEAAGAHPFDVVDFRRERALIDEHNWITGKDLLGGDPTGYRTVEFHGRSLHVPIERDFGRFRVTNYDPGVMCAHHRPGYHEYLLPQTILSADLVVNLPKWKSHHKAALTGALKNLVGINGQKDWLPHHRRGSVGEGGDEYLETNPLNSLHTTFSEWEDVNPVQWQRRILKVARRGASVLARATAKTPYREGSWHGNDTLWRTILDHNRALLYADTGGVLRETRQRHVLSIVDGIVAGEGEGPLSNEPKPIGALIGGTSSAAVDAFLCRLMGFDYRKTPSVARAFDPFELPLAPGPVDALEFVSTDSAFAGLRPDVAGPSFAFAPPKGWAGAIELVAPAHISA